MTKPVALVTGASSGIGATFARRLAAAGYDLIVVARRKERLEELAGEMAANVEVLAADLTRDEDLERVADRITQTERLEFLVNNAGFGTQGLFWKADLKGQEQMHRLHVLATMRLTYAALQVMVPGKAGSIVNLSSVASFLYGSGHVSYCSTKAWINHFTVGLAKELKGAGSPVRVQALCPGFTYSEFHDVMRSDRNEIPKSWWMTSEQVVDASLKGLSRGKVLLIPGLGYRVLVGLMEWVPRPITRMLPGRAPKRG